MVTVEQFYALLNELARCTRERNKLRAQVWELERRQQDLDATLVELADQLEWQQVCELFDKARELLEAERLCSEIATDVICYVHASTSDREEAWRQAGLCLTKKRERWR